ncbi:multiple inositol polyphosphate phosphatase 1-like isoform X2 [Zootermopsis nevadensis]|nr:multiple inositol polyphosphate phosphatase 1-like isoform X2 [Zootermopsis nevadensis]
MLLSILLATILVSLVAGHYDTCLAENKNPYVMFSTYTPYELVHENSDDPVSIPKCKPIQFWILSRHGTRYTDVDGINDMWSLIDFRDQIINNYKNGWGALCAEDVDNLKKWTPQAVSTVSMNLTPQGYKDAYNLALRYKSKFPSLLNQSYDPDKFEVKFTESQRTTLTAFAFIDGIFGSTVDVQLPQPISPDPLLKPSDYCTAWINEVHDNPDIKKEYNAFKKGPEIEEVTRIVSKRLGFGSSIGFDNLDLIYTICRFEKAWNVYNISPWCAAFSEDDLKVLEYKEDLDSYYKRGFGTEMNKLVGCPLAKDFIDRFRKLENWEKQPAGVFYFSHDTDMQLFFTSLGIGEDERPLTHSNYASMGNRNWRTSLLTPFASNFVAIFFKCDEGEPFRVQFHLQEKLLKLKGCKDDKWGLCDWSVFKQNYGSISKTCNLDFC